MIVDKTKENLEKCQCLHCPSFTLGCKIKNVPINTFKLMEDLEKIEHYEGMFCAFEKSHCIEEDRGCLCPTCPVHAEYDLNREDYCLKDGGLPENDCAGGFDSDGFSTASNTTGDKDFH